MMKSECRIGMPVILESVINDDYHRDRLAWHGIVVSLTNLEYKVKVMYGDGELIETYVDHLIKYKK